MYLRRQLCVQPQIFKVTKVLTGIHCHRNSKPPLIPNQFSGKHHNHSWKIPVDFYLYIVKGCIVYLTSVNKKSTFSLTRFDKHIFCCQQTYPGLHSQQDWETLDWPMLLSLSEAGFLKNIRLNLLSSSDPRLLVV